MTPDEVRHVFSYLPTGHLVWRERRRGVSAGGVAGAFDARGYLQIEVDGKVYKAHRLIWLWHGHPLPPEIDHVNCDKADNRIENLRAASKAENMRNAKLSGRNKSGVKGVYFESCTGKWRVSLMVDRKTLRFGRFDDLELAALVIAEARAKHHGAFARHR